MSTTLSSEIKDTFKNINEVLKHDYAIKKIAKWVRIIAAFIILFVLFLHYWNVMQYISWEPMPLWGESLRIYLKENMGKVMILFVAYIIIKEVMKDTIIEKIPDIKWMPILFTIDDCLQLLFSFFYLMCGGNLLIEFCNGYNDLLRYKGIYIGTIIYIFIILIMWLYLHNVRICKNVLNDTWFYDSNGEQIYENSFVIYNGEKFLVKSNSLEEINTKSKKSYLLSSFYSDSIPLEKAVKDQSGKITVLKKY